MNSTEMERLLRQYIDRMGIRGVIDMLIDYCYDQARALKEDFSASFQWSLTKYALVKAKQYDLRIHVPVEKEE